MQPLIAVFDNARNARMTDSDCSIDSGKTSRLRSALTKSTAWSMIASGFGRAETRMTVDRGRSDLFRPSRVHRHALPVQSNQLPYTMFFLAGVVIRCDRYPRSRLPCDNQKILAMNPMTTVAAPSRRRRRPHPAAARPGHPPTRGGWWRQNVAERRAASRGGLRRG